MKRLVFAFVLASVACGGTGESPQSPTGTGTPGPSVAPTPVPWPTPYPEEGNKAPIYVFLHLWYTAVPERCGTPGGAAGGWGPWVWGGRIDDPCHTFPGAPWLREISSNAYPLTGPYESGNEEIMRWQIRQAKAAGIDGFFAGVYSWAPHLRFVYENFFGGNGRKGLLQIAHEEDFKVGLEGWGPSEPDPVGQRGPWMTEVARHLAGIESSPYRDAYITIAGKPAYWLIQPQWMSNEEQIRFFDGTPEHPRAFSWLLRGNIKLPDVVTMNGRLQHSRLQYVSWMVRPEVSGWFYNPGFADDQWRILQMPETGMIPISHAYTGYDERAGRFEGAYRGRFGLREGNAHIETFLDESDKVGAQVILCESWNEYGEGSMLEAAVGVWPWREMNQERDLYQDEFGRDDPFQYLKIFSRFNGMQEWVPPRPPPCSVIDPLIRERIEVEPDFPLQCTAADGSLRGNR